VVLFVGSPVTKQQITAPAESVIAYSAWSGAEASTSPMAKESGAAARTPSRRARQTSDGRIF